jgi:hypothetical protein
MPFYRLDQFVKWYKEYIGKDFNLQMAIGYLLIGKLVMPDVWLLLNNKKRSEWTKFLCRHKTIKKINIANIDLNNLESYMKISRMI